MVAWKQLRDLKHTRCCAGKVRHKSAGAAEAHIRALHRMGESGRLKVYLCTFCKHWHVGHAKYGQG